MLKIITLVCVLLSVLSAILIESWLRSKRGGNEFAGRVFTLLRSRNSGFRRYNYLQFIIFVAAISIGTGAGMSWKRAAVYAMGAVVCCAAVMIGSLGHVSGASAASYLGSQGDIRGSLKASYRSGSMMGYFITAAALTILGALFVLFKVKSAINASVYLALGASTAAVILNTGGNVYSAAYSIARNKEDPIDNTGTFAGSGADLIESYIMAAAAVIILADLGVDTSGPTSTFTTATAAKFILIVYGAGIAASIIGSLLYGGINSRSPKSSSYHGTAAGTIAAVILTGAATLYFSYYMMQTRVYGWAAVSGLAAGAVCGEISRMYAQDSRILIGRIKSDRRMGSYSPVIFNLGSGMISTVFQTLLSVAAVYVSFNFASYYGIALCAAGFASVAASISSVSGLGITGADASSLIDTAHAGDEDNIIADSIETASLKADIAARSYSSVLAFLSCAAMLAAYAHAADRQNINVLDLRVFIGLMLGAASAFILLGLIIIAVRQTGRAALGNLGFSSDDSDPSGFIRGAVIPAAAAVVIPAVIGLLFGVEALFGCLLASSMTGCILMAALNNSGQYYVRSASRSLGSLIKIMLIFSVAFLPVFTRVGGFL